MAEETIPGTEPEAPETAPVGEQPPETSDAGVGDEGRPTGDDPQAVRARKEYQARRRAEERADELERELIASRERARVLEEVRDKPKEEKNYSLKEVNAAVAAGQITREMADDYIENVIIPAKSKAQLDAREAERAKKTPIERAHVDVLQYIDYVPALRDRTSADFRKVAGEYQKLVADGHPPDDRTELVAAKLVYGDLDSLKRKAELRALNNNAPKMGTDGHGGGSQPAGKPDISKAPASLVAKWDRMGTDQAGRERQFKIHQELLAQREARRR
jgi:hypothetical protein